MDKKTYLVVKEHLHAVAVLSHPFGEKLFTEFFATPENMHTDYTQSIEDFCMFFADYLHDDQATYFETKEEP